MFQSISHLLGLILQAAVKLNIASPIISKTTMCKEIVSQYLPSVSCTEVGKEIIGYEPTVPFLAIGAATGLGLYALNRVYNNYFSHDEASVAPPSQLPNKTAPTLLKKFDSTSHKSRILDGLALEGQVLDLKKPPSKPYSKTIDALGLEGLEHTMNKKIALGSFTKIR